MGFRSRARGVAGELLIVVLGVAIALAADSWREDWLEQRIEARYLARLDAELAEGSALLVSLRDRFSAAQGAAVALIDELDSGRRTLPPDSTARLLIVAATTGFNAVQLRHDATYQELLNSGRLALIRDDQIRASLLEYYRAVENLGESLDKTPDEVHVWFRRHTGYLPGEFGSLQDSRDLTTAEMTVLATELWEDPSSLASLRLLRSGLTLDDIRFGQVMPMLEALRDQLR